MLETIDEKEKEIDELHATPLHSTLSNKDDEEAEE